LFSIRVFAHFNAQRLTDHPLERRRMTLGGPELQFRIARRSNLQQRIVTSIVKFDAGDGLGVAPIEVLGKTEHGRQPSYNTAALAAQAAELGVPPRRRRAPVISATSAIASTSSGSKPRRSPFLIR